ncbi:hypothetical protein Back11_45630 [Paenibacillus baekrokdamisoli]|uniref:Uncharacterized protein n=1 Tax=Paenibacillus baekrokdamisoli TaxID=1712516 RepID=A0A3G9JGM5_9BACL|nr:ribonuclease E inhibitor RraB [Paenibacillus baekrokdamisoli]MBB3072349.1 hypothetical protein [Paenibacillus baekrokdamisoli]BBH23218.1 hypothetical protein Back11_45630 [Paenibacillus baekrokdamisoli]
MNEEETEYPYQLSISKFSAVDLDTIYKVTTDLIRTAMKVGGNYDGWETPIVKRGDNSN